MNLFFCLFVCFLILVNLTVKVFNSINSSNLCYLLWVAYVILNFYFPAKHPTAKIISII